MASAAGKCVIVLGLQNEGRALAGPGNGKDVANMPS